MYDQSPRSQPTVIQSATKIWNARYGDISRLREAAHPAYFKAVVPVLAALTENYQSPVRILTVGGGDGHFSRSVLPEIIKARSADGKAPPRFLVTETDPDEIINTVPGNHKKVAMQELSSHFTPKSFDIIFGESMFYHLLPDLAPNALKAFQSVIADDGIFIHLQNVIPHVEMEGLRTTKFFGFSKQQPTAAITNPQGNETIYKLEEAEATSKYLMSLMNDVAVKEHISFLGFCANGEALVDAATFRGQYAQYLQAAPSNYMLNYYGAIAFMTRKDVPQGMLKLDYNATISIFANHSTSAIMKQLEEKLS